MRNVTSFATYCACRPYVVHAYRRYDYYNTDITTNPLTEVVNLLYASLNSGSLINITGSGCHHGHVCMPYKSMRLYINANPV